MIKKIPSTKPSPPSKLPSVASGSHPVGSFFIIIIYFLICRKGGRPAAPSFLSFRSECCGHRLPLWLPWVGGWRPWSLWPLAAPPFHTVGTVHAMEAAAAWLAASIASRVSTGPFSSWMGGHHRLSSPPSHCLPMLWQKSRTAVAQAVG